MKKLKLINILIFCAIQLFTQIAVAETTGPVKHHPIKEFIAKMVSNYHFNKQKLEKLFKKVHFNQIIVDKMNSPYEEKPWYIYKKHFLTKTRIQQGVIYWREHRQTLANIAQRTGVPPEFIVAIIGVESNYGKKQGHYLAFDSLYTLSFYYPRRAPFFQNELKEYLLLCREQNWNPLLIEGSYAAALGQAQFMPSNYRAYAKSYRGNKKVNLFDNNADIIASIANYFYAYGWQRNQPIASKAIIEGNKYEQLPIQDRNSKISEPSLTLAQLQKYNVKTTAHYPLNYKATFMRFQLEKGQTYWLGYHNFYVITRYNTSKLYALAVYQLAMQIKQQYQVRYPLR